MTASKEGIERAKSSTRLFAGCLRIEVELSASQPLNESECLDQRDDPLLGGARYYLG
jgi:hypothetical protein